jgi:hypothetical protein
MLAADITSSWQDNNIALEVWVAELDPLDYQLAHTTIARMRHELTRPPSIATFHSTYAGIRRANEPDPIDTLHNVHAISRDEYLELIRGRARFSPDAQLELARWERLAARRRHPSHRDQPTVIGPNF